MACSPSPLPVSSPHTRPRPPHHTPPPRLPLPTISPLTKSPPLSSDLSGDVVARTSSIGRLARRGHLAAAAAELSAMLSSPSSPNHITIITLLSACTDFSSSPFSFPLGLALHALSLKLSLFSSLHASVLLGTALIDFYSTNGFSDLAAQLFDRMPKRNSVTYNTMIAGHMKNGDFNQALDLFYRMPTRDLVSWTAIIDGCVKNGLSEEALEHFRQMLCENVDPDYVTAIAVAGACSNLGALGHGTWLHRFALKRGLLRNVRLENSIIDMYSKCGRVTIAQQMFGRMPNRTLVSWNSMISGFAFNGFSAEALLLFSEMQKTKFKPDGVSFTAALTSCSHAGMVDEGLRLFRVMQTDFKVVPRIEHYGCLVDLLGRAGLLEEAVSLVESMPMKPNEVLLGSLMAACRVHGDVELAERLMDLLLQVEPETDSNYVILSNIYAAMGMWEAVGRVRSLMKEIGVKKKPGYSAVEIAGGVYQFVAGDGSDDIYALLDLLHFDMDLHRHESGEDTGAIRDDFDAGYI